MGIMQAFLSLTWWQMILWVAYTIYFLIRSHTIWEATIDDGIAKGYKEVFIGRDKYLRLHHIVRIFLDIPPMAVGLFFPIIKKVLSLRLYEFKKESNK
ncbi:MULTISPECIES: hypothetical protein [Bacillus cereus group]|uniref:Uncharacterized protein n=2 Tax=Bacillus cereus TaxID=1396 RepID=A0AAW5L554_BACCE|nr:MULTISPECIES: hypothetical protein [Bacillus cereus group]EKS8371769.1 hypothetical protein [Bacillus cereus]EOO67468.1 hypothetical protein IKE_02595 [Bacillus cereus VD196]MBG9491824.1 hypothetical protein [Bacillus thuringiensis]MBG9506650.1 hypothetical protein [Bacillus thuringiensis]MBG9510940.1 hypothetical protein [Bacillus thuringiensis]